MDENSGQPMPRAGKLCRDCNTYKGWEEFNVAPDRRDGHGSYCKPCHRVRMQRWAENNRAKIERSKQAFYRRNPEYKSAQAHKAALRKYGLTPEGYDALLTGQAGVCALCGGRDADGKRLAVDHCHETGRVRGLLCTLCNTGLGKLGDTEAALLRALEYIRTVRPV